MWESGPTEARRILGISRGRLIVTVAGPFRGIRGLSLETGSHRDGGWVKGDLGSPLSYGQGLVADNVIVWPSRAGLYFLNPKDGQPFGDPLHGSVRDAYGSYFGNLAYADGVLVVVTPQTVRGYVAQSRKIEPLPDTPPGEKFDILIDRAERAVAAGNAARARALLAEVAGSDLPAPFRAWAAARMLQLSPPASTLNHLPPEVQDALRPPLLNEWLLAADGLPVTLDALLQRHLGRLPARVPFPRVPWAKFARRRSPPTRRSTAR